MNNLNAFSIDDNLICLIFKLMVFFNCQFDMFLCLKCQMFRAFQVAVEPLQDLVKIITALNERMIRRKMVDVANVI